MMSDHSIMTFPCPTCGKMLSLSETQAVGPCPYCSTELQAVFTVNILDAHLKQHGLEEKGHDARCFRPDGSPPQGRHHVHTPKPQ